METGKLQGKPHCPQCGATLNGYSNFDTMGEGARHPEAGDPTVCAHCVTKLIFTSPTVLVILTPEEEAKLDPLLQTAIRHAVRYVEENRSKFR